MSSQVVRFTVAALVALGLAACGGSKSKPTAAEGTIDQSSAQSIASGSAGQQIVTMASAKPDATKFGNSSIASGSRGLDLIPEYRNLKRVLDDDSCSPTNSDTTDADADGIAKANVMTFACDTTSEGFKLTASGTISVTDGNDADKKSGFTFKIDNVKFVLTATSRERATTTIEATLNGSYDVTVAATKITSTGSVTMDLTASGKTLSVGYWGDTVATATSESEPYAAGTISVDNWYQYALDDKKFTLHITSEDLTYGTCARGGEYEDDIKLNGGKLKIVDGVPNTIEVSFSSSCTATWKYNGTAL